MNKQEEMMNILDTCYDKCKQGISKVSLPVNQMSDDYLKKYPSKKKAAKAMLNNQILKCTTSGFITGFGGLIILPVSIPTNIGSVLYVQMRMIACCAYIGGYDVNSDYVQTLIYACLAGVSVNSIIKKFGIQFAEKVAKQGIEKIPGKVLIEINKKIGFRFLTKFGEKGMINLGNLIPVIGATANGAFDNIETRIIANRAYRWFIKNDFEDTKNELEL